MLASNLVDQTIVKSISQIARATNKQTIVEHITNAKTFKLLRELGIDFAQGYYIGKPSARPTCKAINVPRKNTSKDQANCIFFSSTIIDRA